MNTFMTLRAALALALMALMVQSPMNGEPAPLTDNLGHTFARLRAHKDLTIGYFGGSITEGAGASNSEKTSYRALTTAWFKANFPASRITAVNAAIGGTGSDLGAFRCKTDLLSHKPDLVFVEFAVNDGGSPEERVVRAMEGIVRQIRRARPQADIVFVYTTTNTLAPAYDRGETPSAVRYDHAVALHYGIPEINVGEALWKAIASGKGTWETLTREGVHPNDVGYSIYYEVIQAFLEAHQNDRAERARGLPAPLNRDSWEHAALVVATAAQAPGWSRDDATLKRYFPDGIASGTPGAEFTYRFRGSAIGLYWIMAPDSGDIEWSVDGSVPARRSSWDRYALQFSRKNYTILTDRLPAGEHLLKVRILNDKQPESTGTWIRIGYFMVIAE